MAKFDFGTVIALILIGILIYFGYQFYIKNKPLIDLFGFLKKNDEREKKELLEGGFEQAEFSSQSVKPVFPPQIVVPQIITVPVFSEPAVTSFQQITKPDAKSAAVGAFGKDLGTFTISPKGEVKTVKPASQTPSSLTTRLKERQASKEPVSSKIVAAAFTGKLTQAKGKTAPKVSGLTVK